MQAALATFNAAYALFELLNIHAGEYGDCDCEWVSTRAPNSQRHLLRATYVALPPLSPSCNLLFVDLNMSISPKMQFVI